jgi:hypothetical protein
MNEQINEGKRGLKSTVSKWGLKSPVTRGGLKSQVFNKGKIMATVYGMNIEVLKRLCIWIHHTSCYSIVYC